MITENVPFCSDEEMRYLKPGRVCNIKRDSSVGNTSGKDQKCKWSTNTYIHPELRQKFKVEIIGGRTKEEHCQVRSNVRVAVKVVEMAGTTPQELAVETHKPTSETGIDEDRMRIRFIPIEVEKYQSPCEIHFIIDLPVDGSAKDTVTDPVPLTTQKDKPGKYEFSFTTTQIKVVIEPEASLTAPDHLKAILYSNEKPFKVERPREDYVVYDDGILPDVNDPTKRVLELSSVETPLTISMPFAVRVDSSRKVRSTISAIYVL